MKNRVEQVGVGEKGAMIGLGVKRGWLRQGSRVEGTCGFALYMKWDITRQSRFHFVSAPFVIVIELFTTHTGLRASQDVTVTDELSIALKATRSISVVTGEIQD
ncbi:hypothetical protein BDQ17DRAFT_1328019 [Cyathus striatus]|nr:hypothetical protein BDQ17DRAFT_1330352 [Cyathus striatus]KAF9000005.1 hypothetical protein BDQ17DRAFT_1328019 [Cyathus striatus]